MIPPIIVFTFGLWTALVAPLSRDKAGKAAFLLPMLEKIAMEAENVAKIGVFPYFGQFVEIGAPVVSSMALSFESKALVADPLQVSEVRLGAAPVVLPSAHPSTLAGVAYQRDHDPRH